MEFFDQDLASDSTSSENNPPSLWGLFQSMANDVTAPPWELTWDAFFEEALELAQTGVSNH